MSALVKAAAAEPTAGAVQEQQYLTFMLGGEHYAIGIRCIKEIIEYGGCTRVPMMPAFVRGVINLRGAVVPVIDLSVRFNRAPTEIGRRTCVVIVEVGDGEERQEIGILVDGVNEVLEIAATDVAAPPAFGARIRADFIRGMGKVGERFVIVLDVPRVLSVEEMAALVAAGRAAEADQPT